MGKDNLGRKVNSADYGEGRYKLLKAAAEVIAAEGLGGFTYRRVSEMAGLAHGLIPYYFQSKNEFIREALELASEGSMNDTGMRVAIDNVYEIGKNLIEATLVDVSRQAFQYEMAFQSMRQPELSPLVSKINEQYRSSIQHQLDQVGLGDDPALTNLVYVAFDGIVLELITIGDRELALKTLEKLRFLLAKLERNTPQQ